LSQPVTVVSGSGFVRELVCGSIFPQPKRVF
jgi:hypothetical protein